MGTTLTSREWANLKRSLAAFRRLLRDAEQQRDKAQSDIDALNRVIELAEADLRRGEVTRC